MKMNDTEFALKEDTENDNFFWRGSDDIFARAGCTDHSTIESRTDALLDSLLESSGERNSEAGRPVDMGLSDDGGEVPSDLTDEPRRTEEGVTDQAATGRRRRIAPKTAYITLEDFEEGEEREAFKIIYNNARFILGSDATPETIARGIRFFFCQSPEGSFAQYANAICPSIRQDVILLRFQYEFWRRYMVFKTPMEWNALPVPDRSMTQFAYAGVQFDASDMCMILAREIWYKPGMHFGEAITIIKEELPKKYGADDDRKILEVIEHLTDQYLLSEKGGHLYVTVRNPELQLADWSNANKADASRNQIWWTRLF